MSTRRSRKTANPRAKAPEPIITRTKSRQLRNKEDKKTEKPELTKRETKSPKVVKTVKRTQESLLKEPIVIEPDDDIQVEYYPNTLKRDVRAKKIILKPKPNFKVIAATNKRKRATPQKGTKPTSKQNNSQNFKPSRKAKAASRPELSMQDMVRMMDETRSLSDEDFMEILTCPSPVWWEDPPDGGFDEDSIHIRSPEPRPTKAANQNKKRKLTTNTASRNSNNSRIITIEIDSDLSKRKLKITDDKFVNKKQKLENILGNIKKKTIQPKNKVKNNTDNRNKKLSESEGDFSDLSFNEEEILKNLEEMEIPIEQTPTESNDVSDLQNETNEVEMIKEQAIEINIDEIAPIIEYVDIKEQGIDINIDEIAPIIEYVDIKEQDIEINIDEIAPKDENVVIQEQAIEINNDVIAPKYEIVDIQEQAIEINIDEIAPKYEIVDIQEQAIEINIDEIAPKYEYVDIQEQAIEINNDELAPKDENVDIQEQAIKINNDVIAPKYEIVDIQEQAIEIAPIIEYVDIQEQAIEINIDEIAPKNENVDREILSIEIKKEIKEEFLIRSPVFGKDSISTGSEFNSSEEIISLKESDEIFIIDSCTNSSPCNPYNSSSVVDLDSNSNSDIETKSLKENVSYEIVPSKKTKDLSEFITVYKITSDNLKNENEPEKSKLPVNTKTTKIETVRGKLNDFFKQCKSNIRLKKMENSIPAIPLTDDKGTTDIEIKDGDSKIDLEDEKNRLKSCDYCVEKTEEGTTDFSCEKCEMAQIFPCGLCNFVADSKEVYKNHVSSCKDVARISWNHNYMLNQT